MTTTEVKPRILICILKIKTINALTDKLTHSNRNFIRAMFTELNSSHAHQRT